MYEPKTWRPQDFGAWLDGQHDDSVALLTCRDRVVSFGGDIELPPASLLRLRQPVEFPGDPNAAFFGKAPCMTGRSPYSSLIYWDPTPDHWTSPCIKVGDGSTVDPVLPFGYRFRSFGIFSQQPEASGPGIWLIAAAFTDVDDVWVRQMLGQGDDVWHSGCGILIGDPSHPAQTAFGCQDISLAKSHFQFNRSGLLCWSCNQLCTPDMKLNQNLTRGGLVHQVEAWEWAGGLLQGSSPVMLEFDPGLVFGSAAFSSAIRISGVHFETSSPLVVKLGEQKYPQGTATGVDTVTFDSCVLQLAGASGQVVLHGDRASEIVWRGTRGLFNNTLAQGYFSGLTVEGPGADTALFDLNPSSTVTYRAQGRLRVGGLTGVGDADLRVEGDMEVGVARLRGKDGQLQISLNGATWRKVVTGGLDPV